MADHMPVGSRRSAAAAAWLMPRTGWGRWSLGCFLAFLLLFFATRLLVPTGLLGEGGPTFFSNLAIAIPMFLSAVLGAVALVTGTVSFLRGERSPLVVLSTVVGLLVTAFSVASVTGSPSSSIDALGQ